MPHWPCGENGRGLPISTALSFWMKAKRTSLVSDSGIFWPFSSLSLGFGSNRSIWLGPPSMKKKMQALARGAKCGGTAGLAAGALAIADSAARSPSARNSDARASVPMPLAAVARKSRRVKSMISRWFIMSLDAEL